MNQSSNLESILTALSNLEKERAVRVLFACESGSRAWGFASPDSDFDVRFIYVHEPNWYLSIDERRDVIEQDLPGDLDLSGWELRKALRLLRKSNASLLEWLRSPLVYRQDDAFASDMETLTSAFYSPRHCFAHYLQMAFGIWRNHLRDQTHVSLKKYLYVLRPLLACRWIERGLGRVPVVFQELVETVLEELPVRMALDELLALKAVSQEVALFPQITVLASFVAEELARLEALAELPDSGGEIEMLNVCFRRHAKLEL
jgi:hypothetical protein